jgi:plasmid stability protein
MPVLHLDDVPLPVYDRIQKLAAAHARTPEAEALALLEQGLSSQGANRSQAELLADLRRHAFAPPSGTPDSVEWLREDRLR